MIVIQIAGVLFGMFMAYYTFIHYKRNEFDTSVFILWEAAWLLFIALALFPRILDPIIHTFDFTRKLDLVTVAGFIFVIGISFFNYIALMKHRKKLEDLVRKVAIGMPKKKK